MLVRQSMNKFNLHSEIVLWYQMKAWEELCDLIHEEDYHMIVGKQ